MEKQEEAILNVVRGGTALGRDVKDIAKDLETYINYPDGGKRVQGRWMSMFPDTREGVREAYKREYLASHGGLQYGTKEAKALLRQPAVRAEIDQKMKQITFERGHAVQGSKLPKAVHDHMMRLGDAGLDYRAMRICRTEMTSMLADEQETLASNSDISSGLMDWVLERGRDAWSCNCEKYASMSPWKVDDPDRPEIPLHPNCMCQWVPRLKTDEEIIESFKKEMREELEAIQGSPERQAIIDQLDYEQARLHQPAIAAANNFEYHTRNLPYEEGAIFDDTGKMVWDGRNRNPRDRDVTGIRMPVSAIANNIVSHTHTNEFTFSIEDLNNIIEFGAEEVRARMPSGEVHSLRREAAWSMDKQKKIEFIEAYSVAEKKAVMEAGIFLADPKNRQGDIKEIYFNKQNEYLCNWLEEHAHEYGCIFTKSSVMETMLRKINKKYSNAINDGEMVTLDGEDSIAGLADRLSKIDEKHKKGEISKDECAELFQKEINEYVNKGD